MFCNVPHTQLRIGEQLSHNFRKRQPSNFQIEDTIKAHNQLNESEVLRLPELVLKFRNHILKFRLLFKWFLLKVYFIRKFSFSTFLLSFETIDKRWSSGSNGSGSSALM